MWTIRSARFPMRVLKWGSRTSPLSARSSSNFDVTKNDIILNADHYTFIDAERALLTDLQRTLHMGGAHKEDLDLVQDLRSRIDDLFMVCVVGEFNAGKSTFINSLLGDKYLKSSVLPTTDRICLLRGTNDTSSSNFAREAGSADSIVWKKADNFLLDDVEELEVSSAHWLQPGVALVDTPGTNALMSRHEHLSQVIVPRADLILFVTSVERPMSESECSFLAKIAKWGKKIVLVINKSDVVTGEELTGIEEYVRVNAASRLQYTNGKVPVFSVSSTKALESKMKAKDAKGDSKEASALYEESGIKQLETFLASTLGKEEVVVNKLSTPLLVADRLVAQALEKAVRTEADLLSAERTLEMVDESMHSFEADLRRDLEYLRDKVQASFSQSRTRLDAFIDDKFCLLNYRDFFPSKRLAGAEAGHEPSLGSTDPLSGRSSLPEELRQLSALHSLEQPLREAMGDVAGLISRRSRSQAAAVVQYVDAGSSGSGSGDHNDGLAAPSGEAGGSREIERGRVSQVHSEHWEACRLEAMSRLSRECKTILGLNSCDQDTTWAIAEARRRFYVVGGLALSTNIAFVLSLGTLAEVLPGGTMAAYGYLAAGMLTAAPVVAADSTILAKLRSNVRDRYHSRVLIAKDELDQVVLSTFDHELRHAKELIRGSISPFERWVGHTRKKTKRTKDELQAIRQEARRLSGVLSKTQD